jgi:putative transcriptional regulator
MVSGRGRGDALGSRGLRAVLVLALLALPVGASSGAHPSARLPRSSTFLTGKLLVAQPELRDPNFRRTVILMVRHDEHGALGLVVNRALGSGKFSDLIAELGSDPEDVEGNVRLHYGGPVEPHRGFVLHSADSKLTPEIVVNERYGVTMSAELLKAMARGTGPEHSLLTVGYAGWARGQLEIELERGGWAIALPDDGILFDDDYSTKWERAFKSRFVTV